MSFFGQIVIMNLSERIKRGERESKIVTFLNTKNLKWVNLLQLNNKQIYLQCWESSLSTWSSSKFRSQILKLTSSVHSLKNEWVNSSLLLLLFFKIIATALIEPQTAITLTLKLQVSDSIMLLQNQVVQLRLSDLQGLKLMWCNKLSSGR